VLCKTEMLVRHSFALWSCTGVLLHADSALEELAESPGAEHSSMDELSGSNSSPPGSMLKSSQLQSVGFTHSMCLTLLILSACFCCPTTMGNPASCGKSLAAAAASSNDAGLPFSESKAPKAFNHLVSQICSEPHFFIKSHGTLSFLSDPANKCWTKFSHSSFPNGWKSRA